MNADTVSNTQAWPGPPSLPVWPPASYSIVPTLTGVAVVPKDILFTQDRVVSTESD